MNIQPITVLIFLTTISGLLGLFIWSIFQKTEIDKILEEEQKRRRFGL